MVGTRFRETREIDDNNLQVFMLLGYVLMRYKTWIENSQKMKRKIKFDLQFFVTYRLRLMMVADTTPLNKDFVQPSNVIKGNTFSKACC
jgi:hypothetical protein